MTEPQADRPNMPEYGSPDPDEGDGLLSWSWARDRLTDAHDYWVATVSRDSAPHAVPVWGLRRAATPGLRMDEGVPGHGDALVVRRVSGSAT